LIISIAGVRVVCTGQWTLPPVLDIDFSYITGIVGLWLYSIVGKFGLSRRCIETIDRK